MKDIVSEWNNALAAAARVDDEDFRYGLCEQFIHRALMSLSIDHHSLIKMAQWWFGRHERPDRAVSEVARRLLSGRSTTGYWRPIVEIIADIEGYNKVFVDPARTGKACVNAIHEGIRYWLWATGREAEISDTDYAWRRAADIARDNEMRLQTLDVQEALACLAAATATQEGSGNHG